MRILVLLIGILIPTFSVAQYDPAAFNLKRASSLYDEQGFMNGKAKSVDGKLIITEANGNVSYNYPVSHSEIDGHALDVSLNYCGSVACTTFGAYKEVNGSWSKGWFEGDVLSYTPFTFQSWQQFHQNRPAWILGVNGFAVQVLSTVNGNYNRIFSQDGSRIFNDIFDFTQDIPSMNSSNVPLTGENFTWLIDGYDFCNRMHGFDPTCDISGQGTSGFRDHIRLLRSDGSILELSNYKNASTINRWLFGTSNDSLAYLYTGNYYVDEANNRGFAIVEFKNKSIYTPDPNEWGTFARKVRYFPGDGLEYIFLEDISPYGTSLKYIPEVCGGYVAGPTIFYLMEIRDAVQALTSFAWDIDIYTGYGNNFGHANIQNFYGHSVTYCPDAFLSIQALDKNISASCTNNFGNIKSNNPESSLAYITSIIDPVGRVTTFNYDTISRKYVDFKYPKAFNATDIHDYYQKPITITNIRLSGIKEPAAEYDLQYYSLNNTNGLPWNVEHDSKIIGPNSFSTPTNSPYVLNNVVQKVDKYAPKTRQHLTSENYTFNFIAQPDSGSAYPGNSLCLTNVSTDSLYDYLAGLYKTTTRGYGYNFFDDKFTPNMVPPSLRNTHAISTIVKTMLVSGEKSKQITSDYYDDTGYNYYLGSRSVSVQQDNNPTILKEIQTYYETSEQVIDFHDYKINSVFGKALKMRKEIVNQPNSNSTVLYSKETDYLNIKPILDTTITQYYNAWDNKFDCISLILQYYKDHGIPRDSINGYHISLTDGNRITDSIYRAYAHTHRDSLVNQYTIPSYFGLVLREITLDPATGNTQGVGNRYEKNLDLSSDKLYAHIIEDTLIGNSGNRIFKDQYRYYPYSASRFNLPKLKINANNSKTFLGFDYSDDPNVNATEANGYEPITSLILNNNQLQSVQLHGRVHASGVEGPLTEDQLVRKFNPLQHLDTTRLLTLYERTYYDQISASVDANGNYSRYDYDADGRLNTAWLPFDFPSQTEYNYQVYRSQSFPCLGYTNMSAMRDTCGCYASGTEIPGTRYSHSVNSTDYGNLNLKKSHLGWDFGPNICTNPYGTNYLPKVKGNKNSTMNDNQGTTNYSGWVEYDHQYESHIDVVMPPAGAYSSIDSVYVKLFVEKVVGECVQLTIDIPTVTHDGQSFTQTFVFNCNGDFYPQNSAMVRKSPNSKSGNALLSNSNNSIQTSGDSTQKQYFIVNLTAWKDYLPQNFIMNLTLGAYGDQMTIANDASDARPQLIMVGTWNEIDKLSDYTLSYTRPSEQLIQVREKNDDNAHSATRYGTSSFNNIRHSQTDHILGADHRVLQNNSYIGNPLLRNVDSVVHYYTGLGRKDSTKDQAGYVVKTEYDAFDRPVKIINQDNTFSTVNYAFGTSPYSFGVDTTNFNQDYYGFCQMKTSTTETNIKFTQFTDALGRVRLEVADSGATGGSNGHLNYRTFYNYDILGHLLNVVNPKGDVTTYTYDDFGRVKTKSQPDLGTISYAYDNVGNVRFTQTQKQAEENKLMFLEYDDLNRVTICGEATIDSTTRDTSGTRLTAVLEPTYLHDSGLSGILTANKTVWMSPMQTIPSATTNTVETFCKPMDLTFRVIDSTYFGERVPKNEPLMKHIAQFYDEPYNVSDAASFENFSVHPRNVLTAVWHDELPDNSGSVWLRFPRKTQWDSLAPKGAVRNMKAHETAVAYRGHGGEPFHFVVMSYDERGRVEALLRYTENLGFDAVYYTYNSANLVTSVRVADPQRQFTTWYGYDWNGRVDSVWTKLSALGTGLGFANPQFPQPVARPDTADIVYSYTKRGQVDTMKYVPVNIVAKYWYNPRAFVDSLKANRNDTTLFRQLLQYADDGQITGQTSKHSGQSELSQAYSYDNVNRLTAWNKGAETTNYSYDAVGNRLHQSHGTDLTGYAYQDAVGPNRLTQVQSANFLTYYQYDQNGAAITKENRRNDTILRSEYYNYFSNGLTRNYSMTDGAHQEMWGYRYSASGEREQKRSYNMTFTNLRVPAPADTATWVYYLLGGDKKQLAVYDGIQTIRDSCGYYTAPYVYFFPTEYLSYGIGNVHNLTTKPNGEKEFKLADHLGNTRLVISQISGEMKSYDYEPFGSVLSQNSSTPRLSFIDKEKDKESGLDDFGYRKYNDNEGRFYSIDPLWEKCHSVSPYNYCGNNPLRLVDPNGDIPRIYTETSGTGHSWISVGEGKNMTVYTFGRYAGTYEEWHKISSISNGPGVMIKLTGDEAEAYNQKKFDKTGAMVFQILDVSDESIQKIMDEKYNSSTQTPDKGEYKGDSRAHVIGDYKTLSNNCTTIICDALNTAGSKATQRLPNRVGQQLNDRFIIPAFLQSFLKWQATSFIGNHTVKVQETVKPKEGESK